MLSREAVAVAREVAQPLHLDRRSAAPGESPGGQELRDVEGVLPVGFETPASQCPRLRGIGQHQLLDDGFEQLPQPTTESYTFNSYSVGPWQGPKYSAICRRLLQAIF